MQATAPVAVFTWLSCDRKSAGPMNPICVSKDHHCAAPFQKALIVLCVQLPGRHGEHGRHASQPFVKLFSTQQPDSRLERALVLPKPDVR